MVEAHPVLVGSYFSRRLCIVNPPDGMLPLQSHNRSNAVLMLQMIIVQHMRRVVTLKVGLSCFCNEQGFVADTCTKIQTAFHENGAS